MLLKVRCLLKNQLNKYNYITCTVIFAGSDTRRNRVISIRSPPGSKKVSENWSKILVHGVQNVTDDKGDFGYDEKTAMATNFSMADCKIIHLTTLIDANDALNKSYVDTQTNNLLKTDWTKPICPDLNNMCN